MVTICSSSSSEEEESLPVGNGTWTKLLDVLLLKFEHLKCCFEALLLFRNQCSVFSVYFFFSKNNLLSISLLKTAPIMFRNLLCFGSLIKYEVIII